MKNATVSRLKATLSEYLARVKAGEEVIVTERGKPIAKIVPMAKSEPGFSAHLLDLAKGGLVRLGSGKLPVRFWARPRPKDNLGKGVEVLVKERTEGR